MSNEPLADAPESVRKILDAMISRALARCDSLGIAWEDFLLAMREERTAKPGCGVPDLIERTFRGGRA